MHPISVVKFNPLLSCRETIDTINPVLEKLNERISTLFGQLESLRFYLLYLVQNFTNFHSLFPIDQRNKTLMPLLSTDLTVHAAVQIGRIQTALTEKVKKITKDIFEFLNYLNLQELGSARAQIKECFSAIAACDRATGQQDFASIDKDFITALEQFKKNVEKLTALSTETSNRALDINRHATAVTTRLTNWDPSQYMETKSTSLTRSEMRPLTILEAKLDLSSALPPVEARSTKYTGNASYLNILHPLSKWYKKNGDLLINAFSSVFANRKGNFLQEDDIRLIETNLSEIISLFQSSIEEIEGLIFTLKPQENPLTISFSSINLHEMERNIALCDLKIYLSSLKALHTAYQSHSAKVLKEKRATSTPTAQSSTSSGWSFTSFLPFLFGQTQVTADAEVASSAVASSISEVPL